MAKKSNKTVYSCQGCGYQSPQWLGRCPECGQWDSFAEERAASEVPSGPMRGLRSVIPEPIPIDQVDLVDQQRISTRIAELDRVLGGGLVAGSLVLIGGDPGIGKSTIMLQALHGMAAQGHKVLYVSGESLASDRVVLAVTTIDLVRGVAGQPAPVEVEVVSIGEASLELSVRLLPLIMIYAG